VVPNNGFTIAPPYGAGDFTPENFPTAVQTQVVGINNTGATVGFYIDAAGNNHGFIFEGGTYTTVDNPLTGGSPSVNQLLGINDKSVAAGFYTGGNGANQGELVSLSTPAVPVFSPVTVPATFGATSTTATDVNNAGDVSGFFTNGAGDTVGFLWVGTTFVPLNFGADTSTMAFGLNNNDQVVGAYVDAAGTHGFVFNWVTDALTTINDPNADGTTSFGVEGTLVNGINDKGQLVGFYANTLSTPDAVNGFLANSVPEPSTWAMMLLGFAGLGFLGYRKLRQGAPATA
jgi:PEP-CTERM motif